MLLGLMKDYLNPKLINKIETEIEYIINITYINNIIDQWSLIEVHF